LEVWGRNALRHIWIRLERRKFVGSEEYNFIFLIRKAVNYEGPVNNEVIQIIENNYLGIHIYLFGIQGKTVLHKFNSSTSKTRRKVPEEQLILVTLNTQNTYNFGN